MAGNYFAANTLAYIADASKAGAGASGRRFTVLIDRSEPGCAHPVRRVGELTFVATLVRGRRPALARWTRTASTPRTARVFALIATTPLAAGTGLK